MLPKAAVVVPFSSSGHTSGALAGTSARREVQDCSSAGAALAAGAACTCQDAAALPAPLRGLGAASDG